MCLFWEEIVFVSTAQILDVDDHAFVYVCADWMEVCTCTCMCVHGGDTYMCWDGRDRMCVCVCACACLCTPVCFQADIHVKMNIHNYGSSSLICVSRRVPWGLGSAIVLTM